MEKVPRKKKGFLTSSKDLRKRDTLSLTCVRKRGTLSNAILQRKKKDPNASSNSREEKTASQISGKRKRKLFKKWRRVLSLFLFPCFLFKSWLTLTLTLTLCVFTFQDQTDALQNGLVIMEDVQMAVADYFISDFVWRNFKVFNILLLLI